MSTLRPELETPLPAPISRLRLDERGYPVPWFVAWIDGKPEFRAMDGRKWNIAITEHVCWVCGEQINFPADKYNFVIGPMCGISRTTAEPACHFDCAEWSVKNCPFLSRPEMHRRESDGLKLTPETCAGMPITRNPGVTLIWSTYEYTVFPDGRGKRLITIGKPTAVRCYREGRPATIDEVKDSVESGFPILAETCNSEQLLGQLYEAKRRFYRVLERKVR